MTKRKGASRRSFHVRARQSFSPARSRSAEALDVEPVRVRQIVCTPVSYAAFLAVVLLGYYELHSVLFGTTLT